MALDAAVYEPTPENVAAEEAAFLSGFDGADIEPAPTEDTPAEQQLADDVKAEDTTAEQTPAASNPSSYLSVETFQESLAAMRAENQQKLDRVFGKVGELQQRIDAIKSVASISPKARERLSNEFPELADMLFEGVEDIPPSQERREQAPPTTATLNPEDIKEQTKRELAIELLDEKHEDWRDVVQSDDFLDWKTNVLDPQIAAELDSSWKAGFVAKQLTAFKEWKAQQQKQKPSQGANRQQRLEAALTPQGVPRTQAAGNYDDDEEAMMLQHFKPLHGR